MIKSFFKIGAIFTMFQIDVKYLVILFILLFILLLGLLLHLRRKYLHKKILKEDYQSKLDVLNKELSPAGFSYNLRQDMFYSLKDCWQREYGYCRLYDEAAAPLSMIIDCEPIRFEYNHKKWLIEFWKGQYGLTSGAEIGIYTSTDSDIDIPNYFHDTFYDSASDEERLLMSFSLLKDGKLLFYREGLHWWLTGFKLGEYSETSSLSMQIRIAFPNFSMQHAFVNALFQSGYLETDIFINHLTVLFIFDKPHTEQPVTRTKLTEAIMRINNKFFCKTFHYITRDYNNTLDKLKYLKLYSPTMYHHIFNTNKSKKLYKDFNTVQSYLNNNSNRK